jgi:adenylate kinase family enzyme
MRILVLGTPYSGKTSIILNFVKKKKLYHFIDIKNYRNLLKYKSFFHSILNKICILFKNLRIFNILLFFIIHLKIKLFFRFIKYFLIQLELFSKSANKKFIIQDEGVFKKLYDSMSLDNSKNYWWLENYKTINSLMLFTIREYDMLLIINVNQEKIINRILKRGDLDIKDNKKSFLKRHMLQQKIYYDFFIRVKTLGKKCIFIENNKSLNSSTKIFNSHLNN